MEGKRFINTEGCGYTVIKYISSISCTIQFDTGEIRTNMSADNVRKGKVKNKNTPSLKNIGFIGYGEYNNKNARQAYIRWTAVFDRCYSTKEKYPTYIDCSVGKEWHNFQNFAQWYEENYVQGFVLDKDVLFKGNKIYSPETCCFVPQEINILFTSYNKGNLPIGVKKIGNKFYAYLRKGGDKIHLGIYNSSEEAFYAYKIAKEDWIKEIADKWREQITKLCYTSMYNYKIEITD